MNADATGPPEGVEASRASKLEPDQRAQDVELLLSVRGLPCDGKRRDPTIRVSTPRIPCQQEFLCQQSLEEEGKCNA